MKEHKCHKCGEFYPLTEEFYYHKADSDTGFSKNCKQCDKAYYAEHRTPRGRPPKAKIPLYYDGLTDFEIACLTEKLNRNEAITSVYKEV